MSDPQRKIAPTWGAGRVRTTLLFSFLNDSDEGRVRHARPRWYQRPVLPVLRLYPFKQRVVDGKPDSAWSCTRSQRPPTDVLS